MSTIDLFEKELRNKLNFKASSKVSAESLLLKTFKFFDLNNVGLVPKNEFLRVISKIGVVMCDPEDINTVFDFYDKKGEGRINYHDFIKEVTEKQIVETVQKKKSTKQLIEQKLSQSKVLQHRLTSPIRSGSQRSNEQKQKNAVSPQQALEATRKSIAERGLDNLLEVAVRLKNFDTRRTHRLSLDKIQSVITNRNNLQLILKMLRDSNQQQINYAELLYLIRDQPSNYKMSLVEHLFNRLDVKKQGEVQIQSVIRQNQDTARYQKFIKAIEDYCSFQGIDDGVFTDEDFSDFFGFIALPFNDQDFSLYLNSAYPEEERQSMRSQRSKRDFEQSRATGQKSQKSYKQSNLSQSQYVEEVPRPKTNRSVTSQQSRHTTLSKHMENIIGRISKRLSMKGPKGFLSFQKSLKAADLDQDGLLGIQELKKVMKDQRIDISETECELLFEVFDQQSTGLMSYSEMARMVEVPVDKSRQKIIQRIWDKVKETEEYTNYNKIKSNYHLRSHPDVINGRRDEHDLIRQLNQTLVLVQDLRGVRSEKISKAEFEEYLINMSRAIQDDKLYEATMMATWRLGSESRIQDQYAGSRKHFDNNKSWYLQDHHRYVVNGGSVSQNAPFGTFNEPTNYSTQSRRFDQQ